MNSRSIRENRSAFFVLQSHYQSNTNSNQI